MKLTTKKFNETIKTMNLRDRTRSMAYEILVKGRSSESVGNDFDVSRQAAHKAACRVWREFLKNMDCPPGWTYVELFLPPKLAEEVKKMQQEALMKYSSL